MQCPSCQRDLPFYFALVSSDKKKVCPHCQGGIRPTPDSVSKINKVSAILSFVAGIPLGIMCAYIWFVYEEPHASVLVFGLGIFGVIGSSYFFSRSNIVYRPDNFR